MLSVADIIFLIIINAFAAATIMLYFVYVIEKRFIRLTCLAIPTIFGFVVPTYFLIKYQNPELNFIITIVVILLSMIFFKPINWGIFYAAIFVAIMSLAEGFVICATTVLSLDMYSRLPVMATPLLTALLAYLFAKRLKLFKEINLPIGYRVAFMTVPLCSISIMRVVFGLFRDGLVSFAGTMTIVVTIYVLNIVSIFMYSKMINYFVLQVQSKALECQIESYVDKQNIYAQAFKELYTLQHNMKNELLPISSLLEIGDYDLAQSRINNTIGNYNVIDYWKYTGISYIDDMINYKKSLAYAQSIQFLVHSNIICPLNINYIDLSIMIGIALDNAIEASVKCIDADKDVKIVIYSQENAFIVKISNRLPHTIVRDNKGLILSTKDDEKPHGIGLVSIKTLLDENGGEQRITIQDGSFNITLILFET